MTSSCASIFINRESHQFGFTMFMAFVLCLLAIFFPLVIGESTTVINTSTGPVQGEVLTTIVKSWKYSSFRSIRYAEPPIGYLRFKPPVPAKKWTEVLNATVEANACPQNNLIVLHYMGDEDCLFLNVFTPLTDFDKKDVRRKAVMVWIHGGSFVSGNAKTILYGPDFLIEDDVILVTLNYRLGPLGFLNLNHPNATGNAGLKDQVLALKWVHENIEKFGGDNERITIFGNSAGAVCVELHTMSESSRGLFHGVISKSGSMLSPWAIDTKQEEVNKSFVLGSHLGTSTSDKEVLLKTLYQANAKKIVQAASDMDIGVFSSFRPTVEDPTVAGNHAFLTETPVNKYKSGNFTKVPYITGHTSHETAFMIGSSVNSITNMVDSAIATIDQISANLSVSSEKIRKLITTAKSALIQIPNVTFNEYVQKTSFDYFTAGIDLTQRFLLAHSPEPVYYYQLSFSPTKSLHELLYHITTNVATHADELAYLFYIPMVDLPLDEADSISITRRRVVRMWTNFAKYGNPTPDGEADPIVKTTWAPSGSSGVHLEIGEELSVGPRVVDAEEMYLELVGRVDALTNGASSSH